MKSAGEPEGRMGELWGSPRPMIGSTMSGKLGFTCAGEIEILMEILNLLHQVESYRGRARRVAR